MRNGECLPSNFSVLSPHSRLYAILDTGYVPPDRWDRTAHALLSGGADLVQVRAKNTPTSRLLELVKPLLPLFREAQRPLILNDDLEAAVALAPFPAGLHLGQEDTPPAVARQRLGRDSVIGLSTHSLAQARAACEMARAGLIDYFAVGPLFATPTKPDYPPVGLDLPRAVAALAPPCPWFAIGGINRLTLPAVLNADISRWVVVSAFLNAPDPASEVRFFRSQLLPVAPL